MAQQLRIRNPHSALAALETRPKDVTEILMTSAAGDAWEQVARAAKSKGIRVGSGGGSSASTDRGDHGRRGERPTAGGRTSVAEAVIAERAGISVEELFAGARDRAEGKGLWLALDSLQDPHNVGAIFRTAAFFGVEGILLTQERSAPLTATVYDVACGGMEYIPFSIQTNLQRAFEKAKDAGLWILGSSEHANDTLDSIQRDRPWLLVIGNEEKGMRRLTEESCDVLCRIPARGQVTSLNASVASSILISKLSGALS
ncbi:MAG: 23S rRNA (guanosine(2251)-2'-O)-methyltransferase RlmB [Oligoflexia bacterium]|nr:23S rRNA (guanosine(2251)-2'-O)-methyltransferase RlmB [Oligoflexia bacterium]